MVWGVEPSPRESSTLLLLPLLWRLLWLGVRRRPDVTLDPPRSAAGGGVVSGGLLSLELRRMGVDGEAPARWGIFLARNSKKKNCPPMIRAKIKKLTPHNNADVICLVLRTQHTCGFYFFSFRVSPMTNYALAHAVLFLPPSPRPRRALVGSTCTLGPFVSAPVSAGCCTASPRSARACVLSFLPGSPFPFHS